MNSAEGRREAPLGEMNSTLEGAMREKMPEKTAEKIPEKTPKKAPGKRQHWRAGNMLYPLPAVMISCARAGEKPNIITAAK